MIIVPICRSSYNSLGTLSVLPISYSIQLVAESDTVGTSSSRCRGHSNFGQLAMPSPYTDKCYPYGMEINYPTHILKEIYCKIKVPGIPHCRSADHDIASTVMACMVILASTRRASSAAIASGLLRISLQWLWPHRRTNPKKSTPPSRPHRRKGLMQVDFRKHIPAAGG